MIRPREVRGGGGRLFKGGDMEEKGGMFWRKRNEFCLSEKEMSA